MREAERRPLFGFADYDARLHRPLPERYRNRILQMRHGWQHQFERRALGLQLPEGFTEYRHMVLDLAAPASGQHQQQRRWLVAPFLLVRARPQRVDLLD